jgi:hypothetical protein
VPFNFSQHTVPFPCQFFQENTKCKLKLSSTAPTVPFQTFCSKQYLFKLSVFQRKVRYMYRNSAPQLICYRSIPVLFLLLSDFLMKIRNTIRTVEIQNVLPLYKFFAAYCSFIVRFLKKQYGIWNLCTIYSCLLSNLSKKIRNNPDEKDSEYNRNRRERTYCHIP